MRITADAIDMIIVIEPKNIFSTVTSEAKLPKVFNSKYTNTMNDSIVQIIGGPTIFIIWDLTA